MTPEEADERLLEAVRESEAGLPLDEAARVGGLTYQEAQAAAVRLHYAGKIDYPGVRVG